MYECNYCNGSGKVDENGNPSNSAFALSATPRPWKLLPGRYDGSRYVKIVGSHDDAFHVMVGGGHVNDEHLQANAALIVEAVNSYDSLRAENEALVEALKNLTESAADIPGTSTVLEMDIGKAEAALALARGGKVA